MSPEVRAERQLQRLTRARVIVADCVRVLVHAADEPTMLREICAIVVAQGGHRSAWIGFAQHDEQKTVRPVAAAGIALGEAQHLQLTWSDAPKGRGAVGTAIRTRRPKAIDDYFAQAEYAAWREFAATHGFRSGVALPLLVDESCSGVLMINSPEVRRFDAEEVALLEELAGDIAFGIQSLRARQSRVQADQALRESESLFREFAANTQGIYWLRETDGERILYVSPAWEKITGWPLPPDRKAFFAVIHPEDVDRASADVRAAPRGGVDHEYRIIRPDGSVRRLHVQTHPVRDDRGEVYRIAGVGADITDRKRAADQLRQFRVAMDASSDSIYLTDVASMRFVDVNEAACRRLGYNREQLLEKCPHELLGVDHESLRREYDEVIAAGKQGTRTESRYITGDDGGGWSELDRRAVHVNDRWMIVTIGRDISDRRRAEAALRESEQQLRQLASNIPEAYWIEDVASGSILYLSPAFTRITGWCLESGVADIQQMRDIVLADDCKRVLTAAGKAPLGGFDEQYRIVRPDGTRRWVHTRTFPVKGAAGTVYRIAGVMEDITEQKAAADQLTQVALYDALTNLPNRTLFYKSVQQTLAHAISHDKVGAVLFLDLDRFKNVNDTLGHAVGDDLLREVATRLVRSIRARDMLARLGGDEFGILLPQLESADDAATVAEKILKALAEPVVLEGQEVFVSASIGIAVFPADGDDPDLLIRAADTAMYRAKGAGRNAYRFYTAEMNARSLDRLKLEGLLRRAIERCEFLLHYQPKVLCGDLRLCGAEALLRWKHPDRGLVSPADFIPLLEETGLIVPVGEWVIGEVCRQIRAWRDAGLAPVRVAINLSGRQFVQGDLADLVRRATLAAGIDPGLLEFELTEGTLMSHAGETIANLEQLKQAGSALSVDDFGTGYSSLAYLKRFPLDALKIDRSFISDATSNSDDAAIVKAIIRMAHELDLKVVAEGVETQAQLEFLRKRGCDEIQGYLFSKPLAAPAFADCLRAAAETEVSHETH